VATSKSSCRRRRSKRSCRRRRHHPFGDLALASSTITIRISQRRIETSGARCPDVLQTEERRPSKARDSGPVIGRTTSANSFIHSTRRCESDRPQGECAWLPLFVVPAPRRSRGRQRDTKKAARGRALLRIDGDAHTCCGWAGPGPRTESEKARNLPASKQRRPPDNRLTCPCRRRTSVLFPTPIPSQRGRGHGPSVAVLRCRRRRRRTSKGTVTRRPQFVVVEGRAINRRGGCGGSVCRRGAHIPEIHSGSAVLYIIVRADISSAYTYLVSRDVSSPSIRLMSLIRFDGWALGGRNAPSMSGLRTADPRQAREGT
jgi:hypothetical protein